MCPFCRQPRQGSRDPAPAKRTLCSAWRPPMTPVLHTMRLQAQPLFSGRFNGRKQKPAGRFQAWPDRLRHLRFSIPESSESPGTVQSCLCRSRAARPYLPGQHGSARTCVGQPYNHRKKVARRTRKCLFRRTLIRSARFLLRTSAVLLPAICGQVPCSAGKVEVRHERKQRRKASAKARTPVHFISRGVFHAGHDRCRHGDFRAPAIAGRPHVPQSLVNTARQRSGASRCISARLFACEG